LNHSKLYKKHGRPRKNNTKNLTNYKYNTEILNRFEKILVEKLDVLPRNEKKRKIIYNNKNMSKDELVLMILPMIPLFIGF